MKKLLRKLLRKLYAPLRNDLRQDRDSSLSQFADTLHARLKGVDASDPDASAQALRLIEARLDTLFHLVLTGQSYPGLLGQSLPRLPEYPYLAEDFAGGQMHQDPRSEEILVRSIEQAIAMVQSAWSWADDGEAVYRECARKCPNSQSAFVLSRWLEGTTRFLPATGKILDIGARFERVPDAWERGKEDWYCRAAWLRYIVALEESGCGDKARGLLETYISLYGLWELPCYLPAAYLARRWGHTDQHIENAALLQEGFRQQEHSQALENLLRGRSIAIVGNGPHEQGLGLGPVIDGHDIVVRFNDCSTGPELVPDYGGKTDILALNPASIP